MSVTTELAEWDWVVLWGGSRLHHAARLDDPARFDVHACGEGRTTCGRESTLYIPGILSRMSLDRCAHCCDRLGIARGVGSPKNDPELREWVEERIRTTTLSEGS